MGISMLIIGQIYFWLPGEFCVWCGIFWLVQCCIQGILALYCPLSSACAVYAFRSALSFELDVVWLFIHFHFGGVKEQVDLTFWIFHLSLCYTEMSVFCCEPCQCVLEVMNSVMLHVLLVQVFLLTILVQCTFCAECHCDYWGILHSVSGFNEKYFNG